MDSTLKAVLSVLLPLVLVSLVWIPYSDYNYWTAISDMIGDSVTMGIVLILVISLSLVAGYMLTIQWQIVLAGATVSYVVLMIFIEVAITTDSPAHFVLYGVFFLLWSVAFILSNQFISGNV